MSHRFMTQVMCATATVLTGCASVPAAPVAEIDFDRMVAIEKAAMRAGVRVVWVNPPEKYAR